MRGGEEGKSQEGESVDTDTTQHHDDKDKEGDVHDDIIYHELMHCSRQHNNQGRGPRRPARRAGDTKVLCLPSTVS